MCYEDVNSLKSEVLLMKEPEFMLLLMLLLMKHWYTLCTAQAIHKNKLYFGETLISKETSIALEKL